MEDLCSIRVVCRLKPTAIKSEERRESNFFSNSGVFSFCSEQTLEIAKAEYGANEQFTFDRVFNESPQEEVFEYAARETIDDVLQGYNGTIFAYGQTGSGKSYTMFGPDIDEPQLKGIIPRACSHIFEHIANDTERTEFTVKCSFIEIYKETIRDLLNPKSTSSLKVRENPVTGVWIEGVTEERVTDEQGVINLLKEGEKFRSVGSTKMNEQSSRSHSLFIVTVHQRLIDGSTRTGRLNLADLAGSEKVEKTGATGNTLEEAKKINQSLSALGNCISALTQKNRGHIPYRDSKLTFILRESLGGNTKTTLICTCSQHSSNTDETLSTLRFGQRAKTIKNTVSVNKVRNAEELAKIVSTLKRELRRLKRYATSLEGELIKVHGASWSSPLRPSTLASSLDHVTKSRGSITPSSVRTSVSGRRRSSSLFSSPATPRSGHTPRASLRSSHSVSSGLLHPSLPTSLFEDVVDLSLEEASTGGEQVAELVTVTVVEDVTPSVPSSSSSSSEAELEKLKESTSLRIEELLEELESLKNREQQTIADAAEAMAKLKQREALINEVMMETAKLQEAEVIEAQQKETAAHRLVEELRDEVLATAEDKEKLQLLLKEANETVTLIMEEKEKIKMDLEMLMKDREHVLTNNEELHSVIAHLKETESAYNEQLGIYKELEIELLSVQQELDHVRRNSAEANQEWIQSSEQIIKELKGRIQQLEASEESLKQELAEKQRREEELERLIAAEAEELKHQRIENENLAVRLSEIARHLGEEKSRNVESTSLIEELERELQYQKELKQEELAKQKAEFVEKEARLQKQVRRSTVKGSPAKQTVMNNQQAHRFGTKSIKEGWLHTARGSVNSLDSTSWKRRWFVLREDGLFYFGDEERKVPKGVVPLEACYLGAAQQHTDRANSFAVYHPIRRSVYLDAEDEKAQESWCAAIDAVVDRMGGGADKENRRKVVNC